MVLHWIMKMLCRNALCRKLSEKVRILQLKIQFRKEFLVFKKLSEKTDRRFELSWEQRYPCLHEKTGETRFDRHYIFHPAWAARVLRATNPAYHVDLSSTLHFCTLVSAFVPVKFFDIRPANLGLNGLTVEYADLTSLPFQTNSLSSVSCMHVIEHIGLGRYGDRLDPEGDLKAVAELRRVIADKGNLLFVVPIGKPKVVFNAHRIYSYDQVMDLFPQFRLIEFALVPDKPGDGGLIINATKELADKQLYGCGCFWLRKE